MLISEIITELISETGGDASDTDLAARWIAFLKAALRKLPAKVRDRCLIDQWQGTLTLGNYSVNLPEDFIRLRNKYSVWYMSEGNRKVVEHLSDREKFNQYFNSVNIGVPIYCNIVGKALEVDKKSDANYTLYLEGFKSVSDIEAADTFFGNDDLIDAVKEHAKFIYFNDYQEDAAKGLVHAKLAKDALDDVDGNFTEQEMGTHVEEA